MCRFILDFLGLCFVFSANLLHLTFLLVTFDYKPLLSALVPSSSFSGSIFFTFLLILVFQKMQKSSSKIKPFLNEHSELASEAFLCSEVTTREDKFCLQKLLQKLCTANLNLLSCQWSDSALSLCLCIYVCLSVCCTVMGQ